SRGYKESGQRVKIKRAREYQCTGQEHAPAVSLCPRDNDIKPDQGKRETYRERPAIEKFMNKTTKRRRITTNHRERHYQRIPSIGILRSVRKENDPTKSVKTEHRHPGGANPTK